MHKKLILLSLVSLVACLGCGNDDEFGADDTSSDSDSDADSDSDSDSDSDTEDTGDTGEADSMVSDVEVEVHNRVNTILVVTWTQLKAFDNVWLRFTFENDEWYESPMKPGGTGQHEELILGIPENTDVTFKLVMGTSEDNISTHEYHGTTESVPSSMPRPTVEEYDESLASSNRYLFGSVDDTNHEDDYYGGPFWLYIIDRQGRILWYFSDLGDNPILGFPKISRDNRYIFFSHRRPWDGGGGFTPKVTMMTLDWEYFEEVELDLSDNADMTDEGTILYENYGADTVWLKEWLPSGSIRNIWNCTENFDTGEWAECYSNTVFWNSIDDTVLLSFPTVDTVVEIDRASGDMVAQYGNKPGSFDFNPSSWDFGWPHYANITPDGTLMVSSHMPGSDSDQGFLEFEIDRTNEILIEHWYYNGGKEWADAMGEAHPVANGGGNVLGNYGTGGVIKEITQDKQVAWYVKFDAPFSNDLFNKMVGHCTLFDDLYALCRGPE